MINRFRRAARDVDAMLFDGSPAKAGEISRLFGCTVIAGDGTMIEVATPFGRVYVGAGMRVVRDRATKALSVVDDREFSMHFEVADESQFGTSRFGGRREPEAHYGWDVV